MSRFKRRWQPKGRWLSGSPARSVISFRRYGEVTGISHRWVRVSFYGEYSKLFERRLMNEAGLDASELNRTEIDAAVKGLEWIEALLILHTVLREGGRAH